MSFLHLLRQQSFQQISQRKYSPPFAKDNPEEEIKAHQEQVYEVPQDRAICSPCTHHYCNIFQGYLLEQWDK